MARTGIGKTRFSAFCLGPPYGQKKSKNFPILKLSIFLVQFDELNNFAKGLHLVNLDFMMSIYIGSRVISGKTPITEFSYRTQHKIEIYKMKTFCKVVHLIE